MPRIVLLGAAKSLRTKFWLKACDDLKIRADFWEIPPFSALDTWDWRRLKGAIVKVDPPALSSASPGWIKKYQAFLLAVEAATEGRMLNCGTAIMQVLDKLNCKQVLAAAQIPQTPLITTTAQTAHALRQELAQQGISRVFIKPRYGSGAFGVMAYQRHPKTATEILITAASLANGRLIGTNQIRKTNDPAIITALINAVLKTGAIIEAWLPKATFAEKQYDLRLVCQWGQVDWRLARRSGGPITNLHLNNDALNFAELDLPEPKVREIQDLCLNAMAQFKGLNSAGIDVLLKKHTLEPLIIEINGQGDLIYQDIYAENRIYQNQILQMLKEQ